MKGRGACSMLGSPLGWIDRNDGDNAGGINVGLGWNWGLTIQPISGAILNNVIEEAIGGWSLGVRDRAAGRKWVQVDIGDGNHSSLCNLVEVADLASGRSFGGRDVLSEGAWGCCGAVKGRETRQGACTSLAQAYFDGAGNNSDVDG